MSQEFKNDPLSSQNNSHGGTASHQSISRCKSEPVKIKELIKMCGNYDDDDDDDNDDDSEDKSKHFDEDVEEFDDCHTLPGETEIPKDPESNYCLKSERLSESNKNILESVSKVEKLHEHVAHSSLINSMASVPDFILTSQSSSISRQNHDRVQHDRVQPDRVQHDRVQHDRVQHDRVQPDRVQHDYKYSNENDDLKLSKQSSISNLATDVIKMEIGSIASSSHMQLDNPINKSSILSTISPAPISGPATIPKSDSILSGSTYMIKQPSFKSEPASNVHSTHERHTYGTAGYKTEHHSTLERHSTANQPQNISTNHLASKTPLKHNPPVGSQRPIPSVSHRNIFQTPQNKTSGDYGNSSHMQTPATIFSHWSQNNMRNTPSQSRLLNSGHTPGQSVASRDSQWYRNTDSSVKGVRRPLTETSDYRAPVKNLPHGNNHDLIDNQNRDHLKTISEKSSHVPSIKDLKENRQPSVREMPASRAEPKPQSEYGSEKHLMERRLAEHGSEKPIIERRNTTGEYVAEKYKINPAPCTEYEADIHRNESKSSLAKQISDSQGNKYATGHESVPLNKNPDSVENVKIQVSVPSSTKKSQHGKTITVKNREYMILGFLGQGMSGNVYRVQDLKSFELRAIKVVDLSRMDKENMQSSIQEINMLCKLQAPCIVQMFDYEIIGQTIYVVLEMGDTDLSKFIKTICAEKKLPVTMILYYWTEMLTAVKYIHDHGVIHSDLKPANFLLVRGRLKLIDFGIASTVHGDMTSVVKNVTVGTLNYISPEALMDVDDTSNQNSKYKISYKSDVWSLGCILYSLVYGYTPFQHIRQNWAKIGAITNPSTKISFKLPPNSEPIPSILIDVVKKCLTYNPKDRPSVADLINLPYIPITNNSNSVPNIPSNIILKIKQSLDENEWRQFIELMERRKV